MFGRIKAFDIRRPKDKACLIILLTLTVVLFFALKPTYQIFMEWQGMKNPSELQAPNQIYVEQTKMRMQAINSILNGQTVQDSAAWANQTLESLTKATNGLPVEVTGFKAPYHVDRYGEELIGEEFIIKGTFKDLIQVVENLETNIPGRINALRIEQSILNINEERRISLNIKITAILKNSSRK